MTCIPVDARSVYEESLSEKSQRNTSEFQSAFVEVILSESTGIDTGRKTNIRVRADFVSFTFPTSTDRKVATTTRNTYLPESIKLKIAEMGSGLFICQSITNSAA